MLETFDLSRILRQALANGGEFADIYYEQGAATVVVYDDGKIEKVLAGSDRGVGIRIISDLRTAYAFTNEITEASLLELAATVSRAVRGREFSGAIDLRNRQMAVQLPIAVHPDTIPLRDKVALVERADRAARSHDPHVRQVMAVYRDARAKAQVANSLGEFRESERVGTVFMVQVVAGRDEVVQTGYEPIGAARGFELFDERSPEEIAGAAAQRAVRMLSARQAPGGPMPVVLSSEAGGTMVHEAIGHGLEADLAQAGMSVYSGKIGNMVAASCVTVIDDATIPYARGSYAFDDEGSPAEKTVLVENGVLKGYMYDRLTAMKDGCASTGNGRRESYQMKPIVRMSNTIITPGSELPESIIHGIERGLLVRKMGGGQVNTVNGN